MKRSEMVGKLSDELLRFMNTDKRLRDLIADCLLGEAEREGMKPPSAPTGEFTGHISSLYTNEWEPEND